MNDLLTMLREHDLPPRWDGRLVTWSGWTPQPPAFICPPPPLGDTCCPACGSIAPRSQNRGLVAHSPRTTREQLDDDAENRRRLGSLSHKRKRLDTLRLYAFRCPDCRHDQVLDLETDEFWDLDHTDYGDEGSVRPS